MGSFDIVKTHKEFNYIYNKSKAWHSNSVVLFYLSKDETRKVGFTATKKIGNAVKRNKAKRRMRALFYKYNEKLKDGLYIFVAKHSIVDCAFSAIEQDFKKVISRAKAFA